MNLRFSADLEHAAAVVQRLSTVEDSLEEVVHDLRWRVAQLHLFFEGRSADAHLARHAQWSSAYADMQAALATMRAAVDTARSNYEHAAAANVAMWEKVR